MKIILNKNYDYYDNANKGENRLYFDRPNTYIETDNFYNLYCDCTNYLDFSQLNDTGIENETFTPSKNMIEIVEYGIRLRADSGYYYFIPAYSRQGGWYSNILDIVFIVDGKPILEDEMLCDVM